MSEVPPPHILSTSLVPGVQTAERGKKNSPPKKKNRGATRGGKGERTRALVLARPVPPTTPFHPPTPPPRFPCVQLSLLAIYRRALRSERLQQAIFPLMAKYKESR